MSSYPEREYEFLVWLSVVLVSMAFLFYSYLLCRVAYIARRRMWKGLFYFAAVITGVTGITRIVVSIVYYDHLVAQYTIVVMAMVSWGIICFVGYILVGYIESVVKNTRLTKDNADLMEEVHSQIVEPILRGETVDREMISYFKVRAAEMSAKLQ